MRAMDRTKRSYRKGKRRRFRNRIILMEGSMAIRRGVAMGINELFWVPIKGRNVRGLRMDESSLRLSLRLRLR